MTFRGDPVIEGPHDVQISNDDYPRSDGPHCRFGRAPDFDSNRTFNLTTEQAASACSENANENDNGDRGKQARQFPRQGFSPNFWFRMRRLGGAYRLGGAEHHRMSGHERRALPQLRTHAAGHHGRTRHSAWNDGASTTGS